MTFETTYMYMRYNNRSEICSQKFGRRSIFLMHKARSQMVNDTH